MPFTQKDANEKIGQMLIDQWALQKLIAELTEELSKLKEKDNA